MQIFIIFFHIYIYIYIKNTKYNIYIYIIILNRAGPAQTTGPDSAQDHDGPGSAQKYTGPISAKNALGRSRPKKSLGRYRPKQKISSGPDPAQKTGLGRDPPGPATKRARGINFPPPLHAERYSFCMQRRK